MCWHPYEALCPVERSNCRKDWLSETRVYMALGGGAAFELMQADYSRRPEGMGISSTSFSPPIT